VKLFGFLGVAIFFADATHPLMNGTSHQQKFGHHSPFL
jgi:hypothetical protein